MTTTAQKSVTFLLLLACLLLGKLQGQVIVYQIHFEDSKGVNYEPFAGGYVIAPLLGGDTSFLLTADSNHPIFLSAPGSGKLFIAQQDTLKKSVLAAKTGAAFGALIASGVINHTIVSTNANSQVEAKVANALSGTLILADDESAAAELIDTVNRGVTGVSKVKLALDLEHTNRANLSNFSVQSVLNWFIKELETKGYQNIEEADSGQSKP